MAAILWKVEKLHRNVVSIDFDASEQKEHWILLRSDVHHDNPKCDWEMERRHLDQAAERGAAIIDNGDLFCAMQGKWDKRSDKAAMRPEHQGGNYLDLLVQEAAEFYRPYAHLFAVIGKGNHETAIRKVHETDLTERLVAMMKSQGSPVEISGYGGYVRLRFVQNSHKHKTRWLHHYHGTGGGGPVTRGVIQTNRLAVMHPDADIVLTGHTHDEWTMPIPRQRISRFGTPYHDEQLHVRVPGYKDAWADGDSGWEVERMLGPKNLGAAWLRCKFYESSDGKQHIEIEPSRAK